MYLPVGNPSIGSDMTPIGTWRDLIPFAGSIVAYRTEACFFLGTTGYLPSDRSVQFGYIENEVSQWGGGKGCQMSRLVRPREMPFQRCLLIDSELKLQSPIAMRLATKEEVEFVLDLIVVDKVAEFECRLDMRISSILKRQLLQNSFS